MVNSGILTETKKDYLIERALKKILSTRTFDKVKANLEGYEPPAKLTKTSGEGAFVPDITGVKGGEKHYYELAIKNSKIKETIDKWKLLGQLAQLRRGKFYLVVPKGNLAFVRRMMSRHSLRANIIKI